MEGRGGRADGAGVPRAAKREASPSRRAPPRRCPPPPPADAPGAGRVQAQGALQRQQGASAPSGSRRGGTAPTAAPHRAPPSPSRRFASSPPFALNAQRDEEDAAKAYADFLRDFGGGDEEPPPTAKKTSFRIAKTHRRHARAAAVFGEEDDEPREQPEQQVRHLPGAVRPAGRRGSGKGCCGDATSTSTSLRPLSSPRRLQKHDGKPKSIDVILESLKRHAQTPSAIRRVPLRPRRLRAPSAIRGAPLRPLRPGGSEAADLSFDSLPPWPSQDAGDARARRAGAQ